MSSDLVGAFERITRELDEVIEGKEKKIIRARIPDELANELLKRINILIQRIPDPNVSGDSNKSKGRF